MLKIQKGKSLVNIDKKKTISPNQRYKKLISDGNFLKKESFNASFIKDAKDVDMDLNLQKMDELSHQGILNFHERRK